MKNSKSKDYVYLRDSEELASIVERYWEGVKSSSFHNRMRSIFKEAYKYYYGLTWNDSYSTSTAGEQDEYTTININESRSHIIGIMSMTTQNRLVFDCLTQSTDVRARNNVLIGNALLDHIFYQKRLEKPVRSMLEIGLFSGTAFLYVGWKHSDQMKDVLDGDPYYSGDIEAFPLTLLDVGLNPFKDRFEEQDSFRFRRVMNKFELAERYASNDKELHEKIMNLPPPNHERVMELDQEEYGSVWVYYTFHKPCKALPKGRMMISCENSVVLYDDVNPYECIPVICYRPHIRYGSAFGHAPLFDLMPLQEAANTLDSSFLTMAENFAIPNVLASDRFKAIETDMAGGMKLVQGKPDPEAPNQGFPAPMNMPKPDGVYLNMRDKYSEYMQGISGQNASVRGQYQTGQSGTAIALATSAAQMFNSSIEASYIMSVEDAAMLVLKICRLFMSGEEIIEVAGLSQDYAAFNFSDSNLQDISRVKVNLGNPLAKSVAGRAEIGEKLLAQGAINARDYLNILLTGQLTEAMEKGSSQTALMKLENEMLVQNDKPIMSVLDNHVLHVEKHRELIDNPLVRKNEGIVALVMEHIAEHLEQMEVLKVDNPDLLDIALSNPIGTTRQMMGGAVATPAGMQAPTNAPMSQPAPSQTADAVMEEGPGPVAESALQRAEKVQQGAENQMRGQPPE
jgi:hypothetical protein